MLMLIPLYPPVAANKIEIRGTWHVASRVVADEIGSCWNRITQLNLARRNPFTVKFYTYTFPCVRMCRWVGYLTAPVACWLIEFTYLFYYKIVLVVQLKTARHETYSTIPKKNKNHVEFVAMCSTRQFSSESVKLFQSANITWSSSLRIATMSLSNWVSNHSSSATRL